MHRQESIIMGNFAGSGRNYHFCQKMVELPFSGNSALYGPWARRRKVPFMGLSPSPPIKCQRTHGSPWVPRKGGTIKKWLGWEFLVGIPSKTFYGNYWNNWRIFSKMPASPPALSTAFTPSTTNQPFKAISAIVTSNPTITPIMQIPENTLKIMSWSSIFCHSFLF